MRYLPPYTHQQPAPGYWLYSCITLHIRAWNNRLEKLEKGMRKSRDLKINKSYQQNNDDMLYGLNNLQEDKAKVVIFHRLS